MTAKNLIKHLSEIGAKGGRNVTDAARAARSENMRGFWSRVKDGTVPHPRAKQQKVIEDEPLRQALNRKQGKEKK